MDSRTRTRAGNRLIRCDSDEVVPLLIEQMDSELARVRFESVKMLGRFGDPRGKTVLIAALDDKSPRVAAAAAWYLAEMRAHEALPALLMYTRDASPQVRQYVVGALGACHSYEADPALSDSAYQEVFRALDASTPDVRTAALKSIREFGYRGAVEAVVKMGGDPSAEVRYVAVQALGEIAAMPGDTGLPAPQAGDRGDPLDEVNEATRGRIVDALLLRLDSAEVQSIRTRAVRALAGSGDLRAVPRLRGLLRDGTEDDRDEARRALNALAPETPIH